LEIYQTPRSRDGGRDIIAKGEMSPGNFVHMAVEVKQRKKVNMPDVSRALEANCHYPKIMIATTGQFSAGVIQEKQSDERFLRPELLDGIALSQLIRGYGNTTFR